MTKHLKLLLFGGLIVLCGAFAAWRLSQSSQQSYDANFFAEMEKSAQKSAQAAVAEILTIIHPKSVVDAGSGTGAWAKAFIDQGIADVIAIDGPWLDKATLKIPADHFVVRDLSQPLKLDRTFDMVLCLETAEHLIPARAASFIKDLTQISPVIVFSAAIPGQGGTMHFNEQWPDYWAQLFAGNSYVAIDVLRPRLWNQTSVAPMYRQNMILYVRRSHLETDPELANLAKTAPPRILPMVHPLVYQNAVADAAYEARWQTKLKRFLGRRD